MRYLWAHVGTILGEYEGKQPLWSYLSAYYKRHPILGSRDRRLLSDMVYSYYRCARCLTEESSIENKIYTCLTICHKQQTLARLFTGNSLPLLPHHLPALLLPYTRFSAGITPNEWLYMLTQGQPKLFFHTGKHKPDVVKALTEQGIAYSEEENNMLSVATGTALEKVLQPHQYWVQDLSSAQTGNYMQPQPGEAWWDCCAGGGGKTLLLLSSQIPVKLLATDVRQSALLQMQQRCRLYGFTPPETLVANVSNAQALSQALHKRRFDHIICDAPCSGSGTWGRTPEQACFFSPEALAHYTTLQLQIAANAAHYLHPDGTLLYITCSVFEQENEAIVTQLLANHPTLSLQTQTLINGTAHHADTLFVAKMVKG
ncbi:MAG: methyltransferase domain-containing protein [Chitinophagia bacterium]|nr:methyltransferase domain-containing protein [Chitinophagia bacterium]